MYILKQFHSFWTWLQDIDQSLMTTNLKLFTSILIDKSRTIQSNLLDFCRKRNGSYEGCTTFSHGCYDFLDGFIDERMFKSFNNDTDFLCRSFLSSHEKKESDVKV